MNTRTRGLSLLILIALALGGCSTAVEPGLTSETPGGTIELAVSETCVEGSDSQCVSVQGQYIVSPAVFKTATIEDAVASERDGQNTVDVTFTDDGAAIVNSLTAEAVQAGGEARLVMRIGDEIRAAVTVAEPLTGDSLTIALSPDDSAQEVVDLINKG